MIQNLKSKIQNYFIGARQSYHQIFEAYHHDIREIADHDEILQHLACLLHRHLKADLVLVWLHQAESGNLFLAHALGNVTDSTLAELFPLDIRPESLTHPQFVFDLPEGTSRQGLMALGVQTIMPIQWRGMLLAVVGLGHLYQQSEVKYNAKTLNWLDSMAGETALALQTARLEEELKKLRPIYRWTIDGREEERRRLASELHDDVMTQITTLTMTVHNIRAKLSQLNNDIDPNIFSWLETVEQSLPQVNHRLREIMQGLHPSVLTNLGLIAALRGYMDSLAKQPLPPSAPPTITITLTVEGFGERLADPKLERDIYYLTRQAIDNAIRHARPPQILVHLRWGKRADEQIISITVRDTGEGMKAKPETLVGHNGHLGLVSMSERVDAWGGQLAMDSELNKGTTIHAIIHLEQPGDPTAELQQAIRQLKRPE